MAQLILTQGVPGSGKSTWATQRAKKSRAGCVIVNRDDLRTMIVGGQLSNYKFNKKTEQTITKLQFEAAKLAVEAGKDVIVADTNLNPKTVAKWEEFALENKMPVEKVDFFKLFRKENKTLEAERGIKGVLNAYRKLVHQRNLQRLNSVPHTVVDEFIDNYVVAKYYNPRQYTPTDGLPKALLVDLDGTIFHGTGRNMFDWMAVKEDRPDFTVMETCKLYRDAGWKIVCASGRDGVCEQLSIEAMNEAGFEFDDFFIREAGDQRPDYIVKEEIFWGKVAPKYNITFCLDDRAQVVSQYREMGLKVYQVEPGNF